MFRKKPQRFLDRVLVSSATIGIVASTAIAVFGSGNFQKTGNMNVARIYHTATFLSDEEALVAGGNNSNSGTSYLASAELFNPATGSWTLNAQCRNLQGAGNPISPGPGSPWGLPCAKLLVKSVA